MKIGVVPDMHMKENLGYAEFVADHRVPEKKEVLDFIVKNFEDCEKIIFMGDQFNARNNPSEVVREFVEFIEKFEGKEIFILCGNHERKGDGSTAIDFLKEVRNTKWHIITDGIFEHSNKTSKYHLCPYFTRTMLETKDDKAGTKKIMGMLTGGDILFVHHAISNTTTTSGCQTTVFDEVVLPFKDLAKKYKLVIGGHIHRPQRMEGLVVAGSIFNAEVGEDGKCIWKINEKTLAVEKIDLPGRSIIKLENPTDLEVLKLPKDCIVKVVLTEKRKEKEIAELKERLSNYSAYVLLEQYPHERKKVHFEDGMLEFDIPSLLKTYAKERGVDEAALLSAWELIK